MRFRAACGWSRWWYGWAIRASRWLGGEGLDLGWPNTADWIGSPTAAELTRFTVAYDVLLGLLSLIGLIWAIRRWRAYEIHRWSNAHPRAEAAAARADERVIA
jgi:hypothetical protein